MDARQEKLLQVLTMFLTLLFGVFGRQFLSDDSVYPLAALIGPFLSGLVFVILTRRCKRCEPACVALSVVGSVGFGIIGIVTSNFLDNAQPHAWLLWCQENLWAPLGDITYVVLAFVLFVVVPVGCFIVGRSTADRMASARQRL